VVLKFINPAVFRSGVESAAASSEPGNIAYQKICAMVEGAGIVRRELTAS
jgi:hypothetical protein